MGTKVVVVGQGYVGLPLAMRAVEVGYDVVGLESSPGTVAALLAGRSHVEDVSGTTLRDALTEGYLPSSDPADAAGFDIAVICVPTPLRDGIPDLSHVRSAAHTLAQHLTPGACVVLESTTYPGTTTEVLERILCKGSGLAPGDFHLGYSPERIDPGNREWNLVNTPKVVSGNTPAALEAVDAFYSTIVDRTVRVDTCAEAELAKLLENTYRHVNIGLVNELAVFANALGVDVWRVIDAASTKPFGFMPFRPGPGVGGHCLPIDPSYLAWRVKRELNHTFRFVELALEVNGHMPDYVHQRITALLNDQRKAVNGTRVLLLGWSYKRATGDWRESPSVEVAKRLAASGAEVSVCDPYVHGEDVPLVPYPMVPFAHASLRAADLAVVMVDHPEFVAQRIAEAAPLVFDCRNVMQGVPYLGEAL